MDTHQRQCAALPATLLEWGQSTWPCDSPGAKTRHYTCSPTDSSPGRAFLLSASLSSASASFTTALFVFEACKIKIKVVFPGPAFDGPTFNLQQIDAAIGEGLQGTVQALRFVRQFMTSESLSASEFGLVDGLSRTKRV